MGNHLGRRELIQIFRLYDWVASNSYLIACIRPILFSRAKKKLIIVGGIDMMADGHGNRRRSKTNYAHNLAKLVESKYGKVIEVPQILR